MPALGQVAQLATCEGMGHVVIGDAVATSTCPGLPVCGEGAHAQPDACAICELLITEAQRGYAWEGVQPHAAWPA